MLKLIKDLQDLSENQKVEQSILISESADKYLGQIYAKLGNKLRTFKQQDIEVLELAKTLAGFRVIGKSNLRAGFADLNNPKELLRLLNDIAEPGQEKVFGEDPAHKVIADERIKEVGETAESIVQQYEALLNAIEEDAEDDQSRETLLKDINKMRTFFEQIKNKLKAHLSDKHGVHMQRTNPAHTN